MKNIAIIGLGLIGGSIAAASKAAGINNIVAYDQNFAALKYAKQKNIIDAYTNSSVKTINGANIIIIAVPPKYFQSALQEISLHLKPDQLIMDVTSIKEKIIDIAIKTLGTNINQFVSCHPIAGTEKTGIKNAKQNLFINSNVLLTYQQNTTTNSIKKAMKFWELLGTKPRKISAKKHDQLLAYTSHIPHVLSYSYANILPKDLTSLICTGGSFKDMTRIATSNPELWTDICIQNSENIIDAIESFEKTFAKIKNCIKTKNSQMLLKVFSKAGPKVEQLVKNYSEEEYE